MTKSWRKVEVVVSMMVESTSTFPYTDKSFKYDLSASIDESRLAKRIKEIRPGAKLGRLEVKSLNRVMAARHGTS